MELVCCAELDFGRALPFGEKLLITRLKRFYDCNE
jgi:hypothetical protein